MRRTNFSNVQTSRFARLPSSPSECEAFVRGRLRRPPSPKGEGARCGPCAQFGSENLFARRVKHIDNAPDRQEHPADNGRRMMSDDSKGGVTAIGNTQIKVLVTGNQTSDRYAITESTYGPGTGVGLHKHLTFTEMNIVVEGQLQGEIDGKPFHSNQGDMVRIPMNASHKVENASVEKPVTFLSIYSPAGMDQYFQKMAERLQTGQLAHGGREALQKEYGVVFEGPFFTQRKPSR
jgi:quercetin dioxygenase-like cupin family protein